VTGHFHLGHRASLEADEVSARGVPTTLELRPEATVRVVYAFGLAAVPKGSTRVTRVEARPGLLEIADGARSVVVPFDLSFVAGAGGGGA
jgi:hypothetical protein